MELLNTPVYVATFSPVTNAVTLTEKDTPKTKLLSGKRAAEFVKDLGELNDDATLANDPIVYDSRANQLCSAYLD